MIRQAAYLELEKNGKKYILQLPPDCALGDLYDVIFEMRSFVVDKINESMKFDKDHKEQIDSNVQPELEQPKAE